MFGFNPAEKIYCVFYWVRIIGVLGYEAIALFKFNKNYKFRNV